MIGDFVWFCVKFLPVRGRIRRINVKVKISNDHDVIPELVPEISHLPEVGIQVAHYLYNGPGCLVPLLRILDCLDMLNHLQDIPPVFRQCHSFSLCIVIETHLLYFVQSY